MATHEAVEVRAPVAGRCGEILTRDALAFVGRLEREFRPRREALLRCRAEKQERLDEGIMPNFCSETCQIRAGAWRVSPVPRDLQDRRVEITGPVERKMMINALNSGASVFMADFEDSCSPTWDNVVQGQVNLVDAIERTIEYTSPDGRAYRLNDEVSTLMVRPRGWHLEEGHVAVGGKPVSASLFDFGLYLFHNAQRLLDQGTGPYFYLPKLEGHLEARLWNDVFVFAQDELGLPQGTIKATVLIENVLAALQMDEILFELREHSAGLNAGRWDYIFSIIRKFREHPEFVLPDRTQVTMTVPFMRAYTNLLVRTCHRRGAHAIGGMAAFIPSRRDPKVNETALARVREDKLREAGDGFDGTWVAHPDLVPVASEVFDQALGDRRNQLDRQIAGPLPSARELLDVRVDRGAVTEAGLRTNVRVGIQYLESWLRGQGAAAIANLMEDAATAEISRSQVWQWLRHGVRLEEGPRVTRELVQQIEAEELARMKAQLGRDAYAQSRLEEAAELFDAVALTDRFVEFLTLLAYPRLEAAAEEAIETEAA